MSFTPNHSCQAGVGSKTERNPLFLASGVGKEAPNTKGWGVGGKPLHCFTFSAQQSQCRHLQIWEKTLASGLRKTALCYLKSREAGGGAWGFSLSFLYLLHTRGRPVKHSCLVSTRGNTGRSMLSGQRTRKRGPWGLNKRGPLEPQSMEEISERKGIGKFEPLILYVNLRSSWTTQMQNRIKKRKA